MDKSTLDTFALAMIDILRNLKDFTQEQMPIICQEVLKYNLYLYIFYCIISVVFLISSVYISFRLFKIEDRTSEQNMCLVFCCSLAISCIFPTVLNMTVLLQILVAPKVFLLEYFSHLVK